MPSSSPSNKGIATMTPLNANTNGSGTNGILPISSSQTSGNIQRQPAFKPPVPKLKVVIRRLPPGLTQAEFMSILGPDWRLGQGRVDWLSFFTGKLSKDPSKPSRPSRAYLHLTSDCYVFVLSDDVQQSFFGDAQSTYGNKCLVGPPIVEYAPFGSTPSTRLQADARAGTIDQDPEFMAFLEGLANPTKGVHAEVSANSTAKHERVTTTPLVQFLKEKKAIKTKEVAAKASKKQEIQILKGKTVKESASTPDDMKKGRDGKFDKIVGKTTKEPVKILNREHPAKATSTPVKPASPPNSDKTTPKPDASKETAAGRQRGTAMAAHIRMLQRDLGLSTAQAYRQVRRDTADAQKAHKSIVVERASPVPKNPATPTIQFQAVPTAPKRNLNASNIRRNRGKAYSTESDYNSHVPNRPLTPVVLPKNVEPLRPALPSSSTTQTRPTPTGPSWKPPPVPSPSEGATQAFVKHANPSQGVTELLLKEAMESFGAVSKVEIDRKKGFAYVDFIEPEGLKKAMAANPISIAQGTVQVMQRKGTALPPQKKSGHPVPHAPTRNGRGGRGGYSGRRGGRAV